MALGRGWGKGGARGARSYAVFDVPNLLIWLGIFALGRVGMRVFGAKKVGFLGKLLQLWHACLA